MRPIRPLPPSATPRDTGLGNAPPGGIKPKALTPRAIPDANIVNPIRPKRMAKGGVTRADGCIKKGHTKGKMV